MLETIWTERETGFAIRLIISLIIGYAIGAERESRRKAAGISTHAFVVAGAALFAYISQTADPNSPARVAAQIVSGVGFLGAGIILKEEGGIIRNLTTAASIWFAASIGMAIGYGWYTIALIAGAFSVVVPRIPHIAGSPDEEPTAVPTPRRRSGLFRPRR